MEIQDSEIVVSTQHATGWATSSLELDDTLDIENFSVILIIQTFLAIMKYTQKVRIIPDKNRIIFLFDKFKHVLPIIKDEE